jgi:hypothetical protein
MNPTLYRLSYPAKIGDDDVMGGPVLISGLSIYPVPTSN